MTDNIFITTAGMEIEYQPVDLLDFQLAQKAVEQEFKESGKLIDPPTYEVEVLDDVAGGQPVARIEYEPYTELTIKDASPEDKELWAEYVESLNRLSDATQERTAMVFLEGMIFDMPKDDTWAIRRKKLFNETVPEDEDEKRLYYVNKVLLKTAADKNGLQEAIYILSMTGADEEFISAMQELFRSQMADTQRAAIEELKAAVKKPQTEDMVLQSDPERRDNSKVMGVNPVAVQEPINI